MSGYFQRDGINTVSSVRFSPEELRRSPGAGQELSRILSAIPGVSSAGEISQDLMVRGGSPVENEFIIDNIPMPGVAHFYQNTTGISLRTLWKSAGFTQTSVSYSIKQENSLSTRSGDESVLADVVVLNRDNEKLKNILAIHIIAGLEFMLTGDTRLTLEVFDKQYDRAPLQPAVNDFGDPRFVLDRADEFYRTLNSNGEAWSRGVELLIQKKLAVNVYGLVSATYFRSRYRDYTGIWQNRDSDNRILFNVIGGYRPNNRWEVSARWSFPGGRPYPVQYGVV
ncbi:MAG: TonB-dependent receptor domain-containing protein [Cyclonatronaceae bacterium]